jgi:hypothetical protein
MLKRTICKVHNVFSAVLEGRLFLLFCATYSLIPFVSSLSTNSFYMTRIRNCKLPLGIIQGKKIIASSIFILFYFLEERKLLLVE